MTIEGTIRVSLDANNMRFEIPGNDSMTKIYCKCGRIIGLDSAQTNLKNSLNKEVECIECRNSRISREIEELNAHFSSSQEETA